MILFIVFMMLYRSRLLNEIEFNSSMFYEISVEIFLLYIYKECPSILIHFLKIWTGIINGSRNTFRIDTIDKLIFISAIFSINLSSKLITIVDRSGKLEMTKNKKQKLYIIYFSLVAFPIIDHVAYPWLSILLKQLHRSFEKYLEKYSFKVDNLENKFLILQYYIKSRVTLKIDQSYHDEQILIDFLGTLLNYSSFSNIFL
ncbi:hypothetical protein RF11_02517 [Thelohanellus kitauei]|uniref:Uncharacterized protein n=1 Tax=Thelohanellus kitauei TaxID=669202 RepID=A0A0C2N6I2_THEKT|nr:hypothetical protein RF11_02517 [Thelohanellus kitauei]